MGVSNGGGMDSNTTLQYNGETVQKVSSKQTKIIKAGAILTWTKKNKQDLKPTCN